MIWLDERVKTKLIIHYKLKNIPYSVCLLAICFPVITDRHIAVFVITKMFPTITHFLTSKRPKIYILMLNIYVNRPNKFPRNFWRFRKLRFLLVRSSIHFLSDNICTLSTFSALITGQNKSYIQFLA